MNAEVHDADAETAEQVAEAARDLTPEPGNGLLKWLRRSFVLEILFVGTLLYVLLF